MRLHNFSPVIFKYVDMWTKIIRKHWKPEIGRKLVWSVVITSNSKSNSRDEPTDWYKPIQFKHTTVMVMVCIFVCFCFCLLCLLCTCSIYAFSSNVLTSCCRNVTLYYTVSVLISTKQGSVVAILNQLLIAVAYFMWNVVHCGQFYQMPER